MSEMVSADRARMAMESAECDARYGCAVSEWSNDAVALLARTVIALHAIIEGRATAPTDAEIAAHEATGATWMIAHRDGQIVVTAMSWPSSRDWHVAKGAVRWWPLASDGRPCAWPEASR